VDPLTGEVLERLEMPPEMASPRGPDRTD